MENLPGDILVDILSRLPIEVDLHAKHVCTTWRLIIIRNKPEKPGGFLFAHVDHYSSDRNIKDINIRRLFYEDEYDHDDHSKKGMNSNYYYDKNFITEIEHSRSIKESAYGHIMVGSCNGLACFGKLLDDDVMFLGSETHIFLICNPLTGESIILPKTEPFSIIYFASGSGHCPPRSTKVYKLLARGFGHCPSTNDYKVVAISQDEEKRERGHVLVYTLGTGKWRYGGVTDRCRFNYSSGIHINGALFWLHHSSNYRVQESEIVAFDLEGEKFHDIALPRFEDFDYMTYNAPLKLLAGNNNLYLVHSITKARRTDIWVYKRGDGNKILSHWVKEFSVRMDLPCFFEALAITRSNAVLWIYDKGKSLHWYDPKTSTFNKLRDIDNDDCRGCLYVEAIPHTQSNVSLKDLGETDVTSLNKVPKARWVNNSGRRRFLQSLQ